MGLGRFHRVFSLSKELDTENATAELTHGVLKPRIPEAAHAQPRRINVKVAGLLLSLPGEAEVTG